MSSFYSENELQKIGFLSFGSNVLISRKASIYSAHTISIGNNVRIDDFCILSGSIIIGSHIHISAYSALYGNAGIVLEDYTGISPRCTLFSAMDDFSGDYLIGPIHDKKLTHIITGKIVLKKYVQIGANTVLFPNVVIAEGTVVGAMSLVNKSLEAWGIYGGIPAQKIKEREKGLLKLINNK
jgi:galactoside O-acetyltransferase